MAAQFNGAYEGCCWNAQALFAADAGLQGAKIGYANSLIKGRDFAAISETHGTAGKIITAHKLTGIKSWWSLLGF